METASPESCLLPGVPLHLEILEDAGGYERVVTYRSMVIGLEPDVLYVDIPKLEGQTVEPPVGAKVHLLVIGADEVYACDTVVTGYEREIPVALCLEVPQEALHTQRRQAVRVSSDLPVRLCLPDREVPLIMKDISASGVSVFSAVPMQDVVECRINLGGPKGNDWMTASVLVRRCMPQPGGFMVAGSFLDMPRRDEDRVVAYLFRRQRFLRQKQAHRTGQLL